MLLKRISSASYTHKHPFLFFIAEHKYYIPGGGINVNGFCENNELFSLFSHKPPDTFPIPPICGILFLPAEDAGNTGKGKRLLMLEMKGIRYEVEENAASIDILKDVSFRIDKNRFVVITGPNGGGKSTIAKMIAGVITPTAGQIFFDGEDITGLNITQRARLGISYALQQPVRFKGINVLDLLRIASGKDLSVGESCDYLSRVGLCAREYIYREVNASLSGGELKRIEIATILARGTRLSVFDEPEAGIDLWSFQSPIRVFEQMRKSIKDSSILVISHQERILQIADEIIVVEDGRIRETGPREQVLPHLIGTPAAVENCRVAQEGA